MSIKSNPDGQSSQVLFTIDEKEAQRGEVVCLCEVTQMNHKDTLGL